MSAPKRQRITQKDLAEAEDVDFTEEKEHWNTAPGTAFPIYHSAP